ncbi:hypothetical protein PR202_ga22116 [Eleusine coracana subsp. coracana]|uniref:Uncharacterized protein n=1 Tax=Eleusine coracana subsp. coracana TaxID=191504 RepID=A0AAV5D292_ELECO|nr:hypothetical protein PR202_ga22116 [Eleusine coracana subsp. coracana]
MALQWRILSRIRLPPYSQCSDLAEATSSWRRETEEAALRSGARGDGVAPFGYVTTMHEPPDEARECGNGAATQWDRGG